MVTSDRMVDIFLNLQNLLPLAMVKSQKWSRSTTSGWNEWWSKWLTFLKSENSVTLDYDKIYKCSSSTTSGHDGHWSTRQQFPESSDLVTLDYNEIWKVVKSDHFRFGWPVVEMIDIFEISKHYFPWLWWNLKSGQYRPLSIRWPVVDMIDIPGICELCYP